MTITRTVVRTWLRTARLPLTLAESTLHRGEHATEWPPSLAFGSFESGVKQVVGALTRDAELTNEGRLERAQVTQLRQAAELDAAAEVKKDEADAELRRKEAQDEERLQRIEEQAQARREAAEADAQAARREAEARAARRETTARKAEAATEKSVARAARSARAGKVAVEKKAIAKKRTAVTAAKDAAKADGRLDHAKTARRNTK